MRVAMIIQHPAPYRDDTLLYLKKHYSIELDVLSVYGSTQDHKEWNYSCCFESRNIGKPLNIPLLGAYNVGLLRLLHKEKYDALIVSGYYPLSMFVALLFAWFNKTPYVFCCDTVDSSKRGGIVKQIIYKNASAFWVAGKKSRTYLSNNGVDPKIIFEGYYTNDAKTIFTYIQEFDKEKLRARLSISNNEKVFLFVGKLISTRNVGLLLDSIKKLDAKGYEYKVIIIGDGEESTKVEDFLKETNSIIYLKSVPYKELHQYYAISDAYVHPGKEPYSLAVSEAAIAGLIIIASDQVGATFDVLKNNENGFLCKLDTDAFTKAMELVINGIDLGEGTNNAKDFMIYSRSVEWASEELFNAVRCAIDGK